LLPRPPGTVLVTTVSWPWSQLTQADFTTLVTNHGAWHAANSAPGNAYQSLFSALILEQSGAGQVVLICEIDASLPNASTMMTSYISALSQNMTTPHVMQQVTMPWLNAALAGLYGGSPGALNRVKSKGSYLREPYGPDQIATLYKYLTSDTYTGLTALALFSYGGAVNAVAPGDTANPHRDSILLAYLAAFWSDPTQDDQHIAWIRSIYKDLYTAGGGVPASNSATDGSYINYPDVDLADPAVNTSGIPWSTLYFGDNYPRLQQIKQRYDPADVFQHPLSVRPS
jgi:aclacinomycin oxidase